MRKPADMTKPETLFMSLVTRYSSADPDVYLDKMMSSPGLKFKDKVFAFYANEKMGFRLGPQFNPEKFGLLSAQPLSPFKTKPPLKGWYIIDAYESHHWDTLLSMALEYSRTL